MRKGLLFPLFGLAMAVLLIFSAPGHALTIKYADISWDSVQVHNRIAAFLLKHAYGYDADFLPGQTVPLVTGLRRGDVDVDMESWTENIQKHYDKGIQEGSIIDLGPNYPDSWQGWLVPTYIIEGDPDRGIEPSAPDLKSVYDMKKYWKLFRDPENPDKGRFYNSIPGWAVTKLNSEKLKAYGLDEYYTDFMPGSDAALAGSMAAAYKKGNPWFGYYWEPTWVLGKYDMTRLEEPPYDPEVWEKTKACAFKPTQVNILVHKDMPEKAPEAVEFFKKYRTTADMNNKFLAAMQDEGLDTKGAAMWFLKHYPEVWKKWLPADRVQKVENALK
jgi:glycine betaine/proline transport system substrate-binding protein